MRIVRLIVVTILCAGCSDATAPPQRVTALYVLESIGGQPLPATFTVNPIETATVFWATLNLDAAGNATLVEHRRSQFATLQHERTIATITDYEIGGNTILIGPPCGPDVSGNCIPLRFGEITASTLTLREGILDAPVYLYRLAVTN